jgi:hypothetical protein
MLEKSKLDKKSIIQLALERHSDYWGDRKEELDILVNGTIKEIEKIERVPFCKPETDKEAMKIKAVWCVSGTGSIQVPFLGTTGDILYKEKKWGQWTDRDRILHSVEVIKNYSIVSRGKDPCNIITKHEESRLIKEYGPYLIYNGIPEQVDALFLAIEAGELNFPREKVFVPKGKIVKTLDQVKSLKLPENLNIKEGDTIGIVSHAPHLARLMKMVNRYKPLPEEIKVKLFPLLFEKPENENEFAQTELMGILGYISRGEATAESYPYEL